MIIKNGRLVLEINSFSRNALDVPIKAIFKGANAIWYAIREFIRSCYGSGVWLNTYNWINDDIWKNK